MAKRGPDSELVKEGREVFRMTRHKLWVPADCEDEELSLAQTNVHDQDKVIKFRVEDHKYFFAGETPQSTLQQSLGCVSVTGLYKKYCNEFNAEEQAKRMCSAQGFPYRQPHHEQYKKLLQGVNRKDWCAAVLQEWARKGKEASELGTAAHRALELMLNTVTWWQPIDVSRETQMAAKFMFLMREQGWVPYRTEMIIAVPELKLAGSVDFLLCRADRALREGPTELLLGDLKRVEKFEARSNFNQHMKPPFDAFPDTNLWHYTMQPNLYKAMLEWEGRYGVVVTRMVLLDVHPTQDDYLLVEVEEQQEAALEILRQRERDLSD